MTDMQEKINALVDSVFMTVAADVAKEELNFDRVSAIVRPQIQRSISRDEGLPSAPSALSAPTSVASESVKPVKVSAVRKASKQAKAAVANMVTPTAIDVQVNGLDMDSARRGREQALSELAEWYKGIDLPSGWSRRKALPGMFTGLANKLAAGNLAPHIASNVANLATRKPEALPLFIEAGNKVIDVFASSGSTELINCANAIGDAFDKALALV